MEPKQKYRLGTISNIYRNTGGGGEGVKPVLQAPHTHPLRWTTTFSELFDPRGERKFI